MGGERAYVGGEGGSVGAESGWGGGDSDGVGDLGGRWSRILE